VRQEIVGTWEVPDQNRKWVFTADGTLRRYQDGSLIATEKYEVSRQCMGYKLSSGKNLAILKVTNTNSDQVTNCYYVMNMAKTDDSSPENSPFLLVGMRSGHVSFDNYTPPGN
jgi:hypothetical protein